ncbi:MAG: hypothetical protein U9R68_08050 [Planctomycetota bacterium]|nr:hypothetical protein [Planctomycetota bacterium]
MALIRYPEGQQRSGRAGGTVYAHNRGGPYIRSASIPVNPQTSLQNAVRGYLTSLANAWHSVLTQAQRDAWDQYAANVPVTNRLGMLIYLTGQNQYIRSNVPRLQAGLPVVDDGITNYEEAPGMVDLTGTASEATQLVTVSWGGWQTWESQDDAAMLVKLGIPQNQSRKFFGGPWRYADAILGDSTTPASSPAILTSSPYIFVEGHRLWIEARVTMPDGRLGTAQRHDFLSAA